LIQATVAKQTQSLLQEKSGLQQKKIVDLFSIPMQIQSIKEILENKYDVIERLLK
jgi:hypothetical protein